jgi:20S proteasome alpha/beta subunit
MGRGVLFDPPGDGGKRVTLIVGIKARDAIIVAADSRAIVQRSDDLAGL